MLFYNLHQKLKIELDADTNTDAQEYNNSSQTYFIANEHDELKITCFVKTILNSLIPNLINTD